VVVSADGRNLGRILLVLAIALAVTTGAFRPCAAQEPPAEELVVTAADDGGEIQLQEGHVLVVRLQASPSTGYGWQVAEPAEAGILQQADVFEFQPESKLLGAPGIQILRFHGVRDGDITLKLEYLRPWETGAEPASTFRLKVRALGPFSGTQPSPTTSAETQGPQHDEISEDLPPAFNWCDLGGCTPVKDQGACGSCWAFATAAPLELNLLIREGTFEDLSEQYLLSCNTERWGCRGGWWAHDYHLWKVPPEDEGAGAVLEAAFPYVARDDACNPPHAHRYQIGSWEFVAGEWVGAPVIDIKRAIYEHGPVATAVCVDSAFQGYVGGVFQGPGCTLANHAVVLVGWDDEQGHSGVWYLRNSWGPQWGEEGYMRISYGVSNVGFGANYVEHTPSNCYHLAASVSPDGSGTVALDPVPNCDEGHYEPGTEVHLTATASSGWRFGNWTGAASGDRPVTTVVVDSHKSVAGNFKAEQCMPWPLLPLGLAACWALGRRRSLPG
jgi:inhibitor of cysteine peptidase